MLPPTQSSVDLFFGEGLRSKITEPRTDVLMIGVIGISHCLEKLSKSLRSSAVFGRTASFPRHTNLPDGFVSEQNFLQQKLVLPAIAEIIFVQ